MTVTHEPTANAQKATSAANPRLAKELKATVETTQDGRPAIWNLKAYMAEDGRVWLTFDPGKASYENVDGDTVTSVIMASTSGFRDFEVLHPTLGTVRISLVAACKPVKNGKNGKQPPTRRIL